MQQTYFRAVLSRDALADYCPCVGTGKHSLVHSRIAFADNRPLRGASARAICTFAQGSQRSQPLSEFSAPLRVLRVLSVLSILSVLSVLSVMRTTPCVRGHERVLSQAYVLAMLSRTTALGIGKHSLVA